MLDKLLKISSLSGILLVFCGVLKLVIYYSAFNIEIVEFLTFTEIITSFLDDINLLLIYFLVMAVHAFVSNSYLRKKSKLNNNDFDSAMMNLLFPKKNKFIMFFSVVILITLALWFNGVLRMNYFVIYLLMFCFIQILTYIAMYKSEKEEIKISNIGMAINLFIIIISAIFLLAQHDIEVTNDNQHSVIITTDGSLLVCDRVAKNVYLGKTDNYLFVKSIPKNSTICLPVSKIERIELKN